MVGEVVVAPLALAHVPDAVPAVPPPSKSALGPVAPTIAPIGAVIVRAPPKQAEPIAVPEPTLGVPGGGGLTPGVASSVAPIGIPGGPTGEPGPTPSGEVRPRGGFVSPTCARAGVQIRTTAPARDIVILVSMMPLTILQSHATGLRCRSRGIFFARPLPELSSVQTLVQDFHVVRRPLIAPSYARCRERFFGCACLYEGYAK